MNGQEEQLPRVPFANVELRGIESILRGHVKYLQTRPFTPERKNSIEKLSLVATKLQAQLAGKRPEVALPLTPEEVEEVITALVSFIQRLPGIVPKSDERDGTINMVNIWRLRLISIISEFGTE
jgi:hypothetical protein